MPRLAGSRRPRRRPGPPTIWSNTPRIRHSHSPEYQPFVPPICLSDSKMASVPTKATADLTSLSTVPPDHPGSVGVGLNSVRSASTKDVGTLPS